MSCAHLPISPAEIRIIPKSEILARKRRLMADGIDRGLVRKPEPVPGPPQPAPVKPERDFLLVSTHEYMKRIKKFGAWEVKRQEGDLKKPFAKALLRKVCEEHAVDLRSVLKGPFHTRAAKAVAARQMAMYLIRRETGWSATQIGDFLGGFDHTTVLHAIDKVKKAKEYEATII